MDLEGEQTHYIITLQYNGTRNDWANGWELDGYSPSEEGFMSLHGLHSLTEVSGLYNKPSMEIIVVDINGDIIYSVLNGDWQDITNNIESWATQEQLNVMVKGGINSRWCRDWKEFVMNK